MPTTHATPALLRRAAQEARDEAARIDEDLHPSSVLRLLEEAVALDTEALVVEELQADA